VAAATAAQKYNSQSSQKTRNTSIYANNNVQQPFTNNPAVQNISMGLPDSNNTFNKADKRAGSKEEQKITQKRKSQMSEDAYVNQQMRMTQYQASAD
jgi:hypothetical protein